MPKIRQNANKYKKKAKEAFSKAKEEVKSKIPGTDFAGYVKDKAKSAWDYFTNLVGYGAEEIDCKSELYKRGIEKLTSFSQLEEFSITKEDYELVVKCLQQLQGYIEDHKDEL